MTKKMNRIGIFPGTFDPPTLGHLNIIQKAQKICDQLIIAVAGNSNKKSVFSIEEKKEMLQKIAPQAEVLSFQGLIVDFAKEMKGSFLIRGLRGWSDFEYELQMAEANLRLSGIETVFFMSGGQYNQISASLVREIAQFKGSLKGFVPDEIAPSIKNKFSEPKK